MENKDLKVPEENNAASVDEGVKKKKSIAGKLIILGLVIIALVIYFAVPGVHSFINSVVNMFKTGNFAEMRDFIGKYGKWAMLVSGLLMIFQSIAAPLPAFFITLTNANLFGWWQGCILSFVSSMIGAAMCFYIARILGRDVVEKICTKGALKSIEDFFDKYGKKCILIARLLPFISFDVVSYAAGLTSMDFAGFMVATGLGQLPACIVYSYVGGMLTGGAKLMFVGLLCLFALAMTVIIIRQICTGMEKKKIAQAEAAGEEYVKEKFNAARFFSKLYNTAFWGMNISMLVGLNAVIGMRINMGWIFFGSWILLFLITLPIKKLNMGWKFTVINVIANLLFGFLLFGVDMMAITPASRLREGIMMTDMSFSVCNMILIAFMAIGLALVILLNMRKKHEVTENAENKVTDIES